MNDDALGFVDKKAGADEDEDDSDDDDDDAEDGVSANANEDFEFVSAFQFLLVELYLTMSAFCLCLQFDLKVIIDSMKCPIKTEDETKLFKETLQCLGSRNREEMNQIIQQMSNENKQKIRQLLTTQNIDYTGENGQQEAVPRRFVRVARRHAPAAGQAP